METPMTEPVYGILYSGRLEFDIKLAATPIEELIEELQLAKAEGVTHIAGDSGKYRGERYITLSRICSPNYTKGERT